MLSWFAGSLVRKTWKVGELEKVPGFNRN